MTEGIWTVLIGGICTIIIAVIETRNSNERKALKAQADKDRRDMEARAEIRALESKLSMEMMCATCKLGVVTAMAVTGRHTNGNVEEAMSSAKVAQDEYEKFLKKVTSSSITKI